MYSDWRIEKLDGRIKRLDRLLKAANDSGKSQTIINSMRSELARLNDEKAFIFEQMMKARAY